MLICRGHQLLGDTYIQVSDKLSYIFGAVLDLQLQYTPSVSTIKLSGPTYSSQNVRQI